MNEIVNIAHAEIGTKEVPFGSNKTKYGKWFGLDGVPWCGIFVSWVYAQAGRQLPSIGWLRGFASVQQAYLHYKAEGKITDTPVPGDIVVFDWNGDGWFDHTGIFVRWIDSERFGSIEGNTSLGNQSNGGEVMMRKRNKRQAVFIHP